MSMKNIMFSSIEFFYNRRGPVYTKLLLQVKMQIQM